MNANSEKERVSPIESDQGHYGLGHTSAQRSAEIVAALRAEVTPSIEAAALSSLKGRAFAKIILKLLRRKPIIYATSVRQLCMTELLKQILRVSPTDVTVVEIAAGFSARGLQTAREFPQVELIEVDLPDIVQEKRERLEKAQITTPSNLSWISADLSVTPIDRLLAGKIVNVVIAEGLLPYFQHGQITQIAASIFKCLAPSGVMIADTVNSKGWDDVRTNAGFAVNMFVQEAGKFPGAVENAELAEALFKTAGYQKVTIHHQSQLAREFNFPVSADTSYIVTANKSHQ